MHQRVQHGTVLDHAWYKDGLMVAVLPFCARTFAKSSSARHRFANGSVMVLARVVAWLLAKMKQICFPAGAAEERNEFTC